MENTYINIIKKPCLIGHITRFHLHHHHYVCMCMYVCMYVCIYYYYYYYYYYVLLLIVAINIKQIIGGGFCDIRNNQGLCKCCQPRLITLTAISQP